MRELLNGAFACVLATWAGESAGLSGVHAAWLGVAAAAAAGSATGGLHALVCVRFGADQIVSGHSCEGPAPAAEWREWYGLDRDIELETPIPDGSDVWFCWPDHVGGDPIVRTAVVGDDLWTMSWQRLQQNDLATLQPVTTLTIS